MARVVTTTDAFTAVAEPHRRQILDALSGGEISVTELVARLGVSRPLVSEHLRVLREVGLVHVRDAGRQRLYLLETGPLRSIAAWLRPFERAVSERSDLMDDVIQELEEELDGQPGEGDASV